MIRSWIYKTSLLAIVFSFLSFSRGVNTPAYKNNYEFLKAEIDMERKRLKQRYDSSKTEAAKKIILSDAGKYLLRRVTDLFPYWYGTKWDFNGYTNNPGEGEIACGYFVSTTLKHAGFNLNRYKHAQNHSFGIAKSFDSGDSLISFRGISADELIARTKGQLKEGLYIVGLDYHVGFLLFEKNEMYFIHSNYRDPVAVVKERATESMALRDSKVFILCNITGNEKLLESWLIGKEIKVH